MRELLLIGLLSVSAAAQTEKFGVFTNSDDVGAPAMARPALDDTSC